MIRCHTIHVGSCLSRCTKVFLCSDKSAIPFFHFVEFVAEQGLSQCRYHTLIAQQQLDNNETLANFTRPMGIKNCKDHALYAIYYLSCTNISLHTCVHSRKSHLHYGDLNAACCQHVI